MNNEKLESNKQEISESFSLLFENADNLISEMKLQSSEEILNGSVTKAQKLLNQILPYQSFYDKLLEAKSEFNKIDGVSKEEIEIVKEKIETLDQKEIDAEVKESNKEEEVTSQINFRIPILKALIFLGGSSEEIEVTDFVKKEMKNKLTDLDKQTPDGEDNQRWVTNLYFETSTMINEGLLSNESSNKNWEIAQKGIDYLSKYAK